MHSTVLAIYGANLLPVFTGVNIHRPWTWINRNYLLILAFPSFHGQNRHDLVLENLSRMTHNAKMFTAKYASCELPYTKTIKLVWKSVLWQNSKQIARRYAYKSASNLLFYFAGQNSTTGVMTQVCWLSIIIFVNTLFWRSLPLRKETESFGNYKTDDLQHLRQRCYYNQQKY